MGKSQNDAATAANAATAKLAGSASGGASAVDRLVPAIVLVGAVVSAIGFLLAFLYAGPVNGAAVNGAALIGDQMVTNKLLISQKIFYFHMPVALVSFLMLAIAAVFAVLFLRTKDSRYDDRSRCAMEIALVFVVCTMATGEMWTRFEWGVWWTWEPRLTTYLILMLIIIGYFILRNAVDDPRRQAVYGAAISILAIIDVPICFMVTRLIPSSIHPVVLREGGMTGDMALALVVSLIGIALVAFGLFRMRVQLKDLENRIEVAQNRLDNE